MLQVPELKRATGLTRLKDQWGEGVKFELGHGTRRDKIKVLGNGACAPVMRAVVGSLIGGGSSDLIEEGVRLGAGQKSAP
jgi:DNA (cytosine-5)-methyltransferase 1